MAVVIDVRELVALAGQVKQVGPDGIRLARLAMLKTAADIEGDAKILAPVDTGALRNSISVTDEAFSAEIGPTVNYGGFVEFGTSRMSPQAYLGPAFDRRVDGFITALGMVAGVALGGH